MRAFPWARSYPPTVLAFACGVFGLVVGSFLNVVIYRLPRHESVVAPRSACPGCGTQLAARDNIPIVSWLVLRAKCRTCRTPISLRYPAIEALTAGLFVVMALRFGPSAALPAFIVLAGGLLALSAIDLEHRLLPKRIVYPLLGAGAMLLTVASLVLGEPRAMGGAVLGGVLAWVPLRLVHLIAPRGLAYGDVRLAMVLGLNLGWLSLAHVGLGLFLGFAFGSIHGIGLMLLGRGGRKTAIPFGPFLAAGTLTAVLVGEAILGWYPPTAGVEPLASRVTAGHSRALRA